MRCDTCQREVLEVSRVVIYKKEQAKSYSQPSPGTAKVPQE